MQQVQLDRASKCRASSLLAFAWYFLRVSCWNNNSIPAPTSSPVYCGSCAIVGGVGAHIWWSSIFTTYLATIIFTVDEGSGSTIGSSTITYNTTTTLDDPQNVTAYIADNSQGIVQTTLLNTLAESDLDTTVIQTNFLVVNTYLLSTQYINSTLSGTAQTQCLPTSYLPNANSTANTGLPHVAIYTYTTLIPFDSVFNLSNAEAAGKPSLASQVGNYLGWNNCTFYGGGDGTLRVGVTALTSTSVQYVNAAEVASTPMPIVPMPIAATTEAAPAASPAPLPQLTSTAGSVTVPAASSLVASLPVSNIPAPPAATDSTVSPGAALSSTFNPPSHGTSTSESKPLSVSSITSAPAEFTGDAKKIDQNIFLCAAGIFVVLAVLC